jgi:hypothetical protein
MKPELTPTRHATTATILQSLSGTVDDHWVAATRQLPANPTTNSESAIVWDLEPVPIPYDSDTGLVETVMESIHRSLESAEVSVLEIEAVLARLHRTREAQIDLEFVVNNMMYDVPKAWLRDASGSDQRHRTGTGEAADLVLDRMAISA